MGRTLGQNKAKKPAKSPTARAAAALGISPRLTKLALIHAVGNLMSEVDQLRGERDEAWAREKIIVAQRDHAEDANVTYQHRIDEITTERDAAKAHAASEEKLNKILQSSLETERKSKNKAQEKAKALYRAYRQSLEMVHLLTSPEHVYCSGDAKWRQVPVDNPLTAGIAAASILFGNMADIGKAAAGKDGD